MTTATFPAHRELLDAATRLERALARFAGDQPGLVRARHILAESAARCRAVAAALLTDPTLTTEPPYSARFRSVNLVAEIARHLPALVRIAEIDPARGEKDRQERKAEAETLFARLGVLAADAIATVARADSLTESGSRAISRDRLATHRGDLREASDLIHRAVVDALRTPHPDPLACELAELADRLRRHVGELDDDAESGAGPR